MCIRDRPLGEEAIQEARQLMLGSNNILGPKDGKPIVTPSQDMVLGNYYLTLADEGGLGEGTVFADRNEVDHAYFCLLYTYTVVTREVSDTIKPIFEAEAHTRELDTNPILESHGVIQVLDVYVDAVSYTHLDVYKRQWVSSSHIKEGCV